MTRRQDRLVRVLLNECHSFRGNIIASFEHIKVRAAAEPRRIKPKSVFSWLHKIVNKPRHFLTDQIVNDQRRSAGFGNFIRDRRAWIEWIGIILTKRDLLGDCR